MDIKNTSVYVKTNADGFITEINSDIFIPDTSGWVKIDEGNGDKYAHAQGNYLPKPICDEYGRYNFRLIDSKVTVIPEEDKLSAPDPEPAPPSNAELARRVSVNNASVTDLQLAITEIYEMLLREDK